MLKSLMGKCSVIAIACSISLSAFAVAEIPRNVDVPAGQLVEALKSLATQSEVELLYQPEQLRNIHTDGVKGVYSAQEAITILLKGTDLRIHTVESGAMIITPTPTGEKSSTGREVRSAVPTSASNESHPVRLAPFETPPAAENRSFWSRFRLAQAEADASGARSDAEEARESGKVEEVIVTAQKRAESIQNVPISAQIVSGAALAEQNFNTLGDLTRIVPGVQISTGGYANSIFVRGIGSNENPSFEQSVATFVDDIYSGRSRLSNSAFLDLERVEFLKGPQSTFFGNNAIAGALNIVTKKPGANPEALARALYGTHGNYAFEGAIGGPLSDKFRARVAVGADGIGEGWMRNIDTNERLPIKHNIAGRATVTYLPTDDLDITLKVEGSRSRTRGTPYDAPYQYSDCPPPAPLAVNAVYRECSLALSQGVPMGLDSDQTAGLDGQGSQLETFASVLTASYEGWGHTFTSVTGYTTYDSEFTFDAAGVRTWRNTTIQPEDSHQFSQELRVASPTGGRLEYLGGLYYQRQNLYTVIQTNAPFLNGTITSLFPAIIPYLPWAFRTDSRQNEELYSVFGSLAWNVNERWQLKAGLRGSKVEKDWDGQLHYGTATEIYGGFVQLPGALESVPAILGPPGQKLATESAHAWMPSAGVQYRLGPSAMAYASYTRGFKAGGFNAVDPSNNNGAPGNGAFQPEYVNAYEVGLKSKWLDDRVLLNADVFRSDYSDLQVTSFVFVPVTNTYVSAVRNAAESRSQGAELELQWAPTSAFKLGLNMTYLDSKYISYTSAGTTVLQRQNGLRVQDLSGRPTDFAPEWSGRLVASYSADLMSDYRLLFEVSPYFTTRFFTSNATDDPLFVVPGYVRYDARMSVRHAGSDWGLDLIVKNLADRVIPLRDSAGFAQKLEPRNFALQLRYAF